MGDGGHYNPCDGLVGRYVNGGLNDNSLGTSQYICLFVYNHYMQGDLFDTGQWVSVMSYHLHVYLTM